MDDTQKLDAAFVRALGLADGSDLDGVGYGKTAEWDSVGHLQLIAEIEESFGISLKAQDVVEMTDYDSVRQLLCSSYGLKC